MKVHFVKTWPAYFEPVNKGYKLAELRVNDRDYQEGDILNICEYLDGVGYTGNFCIRKIVHVANVDKIAQGYVLLSLETMRDICVTQ